MTGSLELLVSEIELSLGTHSEHQSKPQFEGS